MKVYLDGAEVDASMISPALHRFVGMFRASTPPTFNANWWCPGCGECTQVVGQEHRHWREGHFDMPQYASTPAQLAVWGYRDGAPIYEDPTK